MKKMQTQLNKQCKKEMSIPLLCFSRLKTIIIQCISLQTPKNFIANRGFIHDIVHVGCCLKGQKNYSGWDFT